MEAHLTSPIAVEIIGNLTAKRAAETAAGFRFLHFHQLQSLNVLEQLARRFFQAQFAQTVAAVVKRRASRKPRADVEHAQPIDQEV